MTRLTLDFTRISLSEVRPPVKLAATSLKLSVSTCDHCGYHRYYIYNQGLSSQCRCVSSVRVGTLSNFPLAPATSPIAEPMGRV